MDPALLSEWEPVIGLEIHVQLNTQSKLFSHAPNRFGDEPNTNITDVCTGQPGTLPILNQEAVRKAVLLGCAVKADIAKYSCFDRKSYFYPDSPRNFQITQFEMPLLKGGEIVTDCDGEIKKFFIECAHLEDDAGMLKHFSGFAGVDYNRAGVPLIEIVSKPCMFSPREAASYAMALKAILEYLEISDCNMEEGSLRIDVNISSRRKGEKTLRNKVEIKNMNSFAFLQMALESEFKRQVKAYLDNPEEDPRKVIEQSTFRWDPEKKATLLMRRKESAEDYRYFIEPDLPPLILEQDYIDMIRKTLPELPYEREKRYIQQYHLEADAAFILISEKKLADYFEEGLKTCKNPKSLCNWMVVEFAGRLKQSGTPLWKSGISPQNMGSLVNAIDKGTITGKIAKKVADIMVESPHKAPEQIIEENPDYKPLHDEALLNTIVDRVLKENTQSVNDYLSGKEKAFAYLVGQVMKATQGKASPAIANALLKKKLSQ